MRTCMLVAVTCLVVVSQASQSGSESEGETRVDTRTFPPTMQLTTSAPSSSGEEVMEGADQPIQSDQELRTQQGWWREESSEPMVKSPMLYVAGLFIVTLVGLCWMRAYVNKRRFLSGKKERNLYDLENNDGFVSKHRRVRYRSTIDVPEPLGPCVSYSSAFIVPPLSVRSKNNEDEECSDVESIVLGKKPSAIYGSVASSGKGSASGFRLSLQSVRSFTSKLGILSPSEPRGFLSGLTESYFSRTLTETGNPTTSRTPSNAYDEDSSDGDSSDDDKTVGVPIRIVTAPTPRTPLLGTPPDAMFRFGKSSTIEPASSGGIWIGRPASPSSLNIPPDVDALEDTQREGFRESIVLSPSTGEHLDAPPTPTRAPSLRERFSAATEYFTQWVTRRVDGQMVRQQEKVPVDPTKRATRRKTTIRRPTE